MTASFIVCIDESGDEGFDFLLGEKAAGPVHSRQHPPAASRS